MAIWVTNTSTTDRAEFKLRETGSTGKVIYHGTLLAGESPQPNGVGAPEGINFNGGLYFEIVSGTMDGTVSIR